MNARYSTWPQIETSLTPKRTEVSTHLQSPTILLSMQWPQVITEWDSPASHEVIPTAPYCNPVPTSLA
jgi:hypothetical protein